MAQKKQFSSRPVAVEHARAARTKDTLRGGLFALLESKSLDQISIRDITAAADVGYATFFRHYETKDALLHDIAADQIRRLVHMALPMLEMSEPRPASVALCGYVNDHRKLWSRLLTGGAAGALREEFLRVSTEVAATRRRPDGKAWLPGEFATIFVVSSTIELFAWWLRQKRPMSVERIAEIHERLIITPAINPNYELGYMAATKAAKKKLR